MKKIIFIIAIMFFTLNVMAQDFRHVIKTNPMGLFYSINFTYEKPINDNSSVTFKFRHYRLPEEFRFNDNVHTIPQKSTDLKFGYRFYLSKKHSAPNGFYISPTADIMLRAKEEYYNIGKRTDFGAGFNTGKQWIWGKFAFDIYGGVNFSFEPNNTAVLPVGGLSLGFAIE